MLLDSFAQWSQVVVDSLVVIVDCHGEDFFGPLLADHVPVQVFVDLQRYEESISQESVGQERGGIASTFFGGGGAFFRELVLTSTVSWFSLADFFWSTSDSTTKKWWHFSHLTKRVEAGKQKQSSSAGESSRRIDRNGQLDTHKQTFQHWCKDCHIWDSRSGCPCPPVLWWSSRLDSYSAPERDRWEDCQLPCTTNSWSTGTASAPPHGSYLQSIT